MEKEKDEIEITPEMIRAGVCVYLSWDAESEEPEALAFALFDAMAKAAQTRLG